MFGDRWLAYLEPGDELHDGFFTHNQLVKNPSPSRVGNGMEDVYRCGVSGHRFDYT